MGITRSVWVVLLASLCVGLAEAESSAEPEAREKQAKAPSVPLEVEIDKSKVDLDARRLVVRMSRAPGHIQIKVISESGVTLADETHDFAGRAANSPLVVSWTPSSAERVARIEVFAHDQDGFYKGIAIIPWSLEIPHEEVNFETNKAAIRGSEEPKLQHSLRLINEALKEHGDLGAITLYIAGHTDTMGESTHNLNLSRRRARAIASWFHHTA